ncbi:MAG: hypothetical protein ACYSUQ_05355 [Planctomycetota bacterium]|jgi:hypothetical protein
MLERVALASLLLALTGCAASITPDLVVTYVDPEGVTPQRVALLPVTAGEGLEGFRRMTADNVYADLRASRPEISFLSADSTLDLLNEHGLAQPYAEMVVTYETTGVLDKAMLQQMGDVLDVDHLLHVAVRYSEGSETKYSIWTGYDTTEKQNLGLFAHLWSPEEGDIVWEASGGAEVSASEFETTRSLPEILNVACKELAANFPSGNLSGTGIDSR